MDESTSKEKILKEIRLGLMTKIENPYNISNTEIAVMQPLDESIDLQFARELSALGGKFIFCENENDLTDILKMLIRMKI